MRTDDLMPDSVTATGGAITLIPSHLGGLRREYNPEAVALDASSALGQVLARLNRALDAARAGAEHEVPAAFRTGLLGAVPRLRRYALSLTHHGADADDLVQHTPLDVWEHRASLRDRQGALDRLKPAQREAHLLIAVEGLSYEAAADLIGCPACALKSRVSRARDRLGQDLDRDSPNPLGADRTA